MVFPTGDDLDNVQENVFGDNVEENDLFRSQELGQFWHFSCTCRRCKDKTEFSSYVDAVLCSDCGQGGCVPLNSSPGAEWMCELCYGSQDDEVSDRRMPANRRENLC